MSATRRVLVVTPTPPAPNRSGFDGRVFHLARQLALRHDVTVLCHVTAEDEDAATALRDVVAAVNTVPLRAPSRTAKRKAQVQSVLTGRSYELSRQRTAEMQTEIDRLLTQQRFDVVQVESAQMGGLVFSGGPIVLLDEHNVEYELIARMSRQERSWVRRLYTRQEAAKLRRAEVAMWARVDGCAVTSAREEQIVRRHAPATPTAVVANGVDLSHFAPARYAAAEPNRMVFTGTMNYRPNVDAVMHFVEDVLPTVLTRFPDAVLTICGQNPPAEVAALGGPHVIVTGRVADVRPYLAGASVVVAPVRMGSGTRLKVLEAMASGRPVVSTGVGCEGLDMLDGEHLLVADGAQDFATGVCRLLSDRPLAERLSRSGRQVVEQRYGWAAAAESLEELHARLTGLRAAA